MSEQPQVPIIKSNTALGNRQLEVILTGFGLQKIKTVSFIAGEKAFSKQLTGRNQTQYNIGALDNNDGIPADSGWDRNALSASFLGNPVFDQFYIDKMDWVDLDGRSHGDPQFFIDLALFEISQSRNIITTALQGYNGTVKEYISDGDYFIKIRGALVDKNPMRYPKEQMQTLIDISKANIAVPVVSDFLQLFGIYNMVIKELSFPQKEGFRNTQLFEIDALSDAPINLILTNTQ